MIPQIQDDLRQDFILPERQTSRTYRLDQEKNCLIDYTDEQDAVKQAIYLILNTERYEYPIYSWNYGVELTDLIGQSPSYALPEVKRRITEALMQDDRITGVNAFSFETIKGKVHATFTVQTVFGEVQAERTVEL